jgi:hypothetical protein
MTKTLFILVLMLLLATSAYAKHEEISAGPYNVSFDLNTTRDYTVSLSPESLENNSSLYLITIKLDNNTKAGVGISKYNDWQYADFPCDFWQSLWLRSDQYVMNYSITYPIIDGKKGQVIKQTARLPSLNNTTRYQNYTVAEYWADGKKIEGYGLLVGKTDVEMILYWPENLTEDLLRTIHVGMAEQNELEQMATRLETKAASDIIPSIEVRDQTGRDPKGVVIIPQVVSRGPSFVVVFDEYNNILGYEAVDNGVNKNVQVTLDQLPQTDQLYATLNNGGAVQTKYWQYPFMPDAQVESDLFSDSRFSAPFNAVPPKGSSDSVQSWLDSERSTSRMDPNYDREVCIRNMMAHGYPQSQAVFYCD